jgi:hypothetical protein
MIVRADSAFYSYDIVAEARRAGPVLSQAAFMYHEVTW